MIVIDLFISHRIEVKSKFPFSYPLGYPFSFIRFKVEDEFILNSLSDKCQEIVSS